ncbi:hypothetical protein Zm00014a_011473 [Zea mays]|uniref:Uncharacterized protein n=1 Tax=Zea mays TaxID=4577 RepID=A0A317Y3W5_MAIZE|nr:hypothetical protein Zm00014a_011473 [Zea mays]
MRYSFSHRIRFVVHQFFAIEMPVSCSCLVHCHGRIWSYRGPLQLNRALVDQCLMYLFYFSFDYCRLCYRSKDDKKCSSSGLSSLGLLGFG